MTTAGALPRTNVPQLIALAGVSVAILSILLNIGFFTRPGTGEVIEGLAHHGFVLGLMLILTANSRTVSLPTLAIFWLLGVWAVFGLTYLLQDQIVSIFGADVDGEFVGTWLAPFSEEALKLAPVAVFLLLAARGNRQPSISDGLLLGFMVGAGVTFMEDAHYGEILGSGEGWSAATPWTRVFPTISPLEGYFALNHALWAALSGLTIGAAVMLRHWRWAWPIALIGPVLSVTNHLMANHFTFSEFGTRALLNRASGGGVPWFYDTIRDLTDGGRLPMLLLIAGTVAVVVGESLILRWVSKRDRMFASLPLGHVFGLIARSASKAGAAQLIAAERYVRLRRSVYFAGWRKRLAHGYPNVSDADFSELVTLAARLEILPPPETSQQTAAAPADAAADAAAAAAAPADPDAAAAPADPAAAPTVSDAPAGDAPPAG